MADGVRKDEEFSGTKPVEERHRIDEAAASTRWMRDHVEGYQGPLTVLQFKGGQSNPTYRLDTPGRSYVMRRKPFGKLLPSAHAVDREFRVISALGKQGFPVAKAYALCTDDSVIGTAFYIMSMEEGRVFWDPTLPSQTPRARRKIFTSKIETLAKLHNFDPEAIGLGDFGKPGNYFARQVDRWTKQYRASETQHIPEMERLIEWLPKHAARTGARLDRPWRLSPRQHDLPSDRAAGEGGARLGAVDARRSHGRLHLSADALDHAGSRRSATSRRSASRPWRRRRRSTATSPARRCRT